MNNFIVIGIISWLLPGVGHLLQGRLKRGLLIGASIWALFIIGIIGGGAYYPGFEFKDGSLLYLLNVFSKFGNGLGAILTFIFTGKPSPNVAALASFEYAGRFLEVAGLLNYLAVMDAVDINQERKK